MLVVLWRRPVSEVEEAGEQEAAFGDSGVLGYLWAHASELERILDKAGFVWGRSMRIHLVGWAINSDTAQKIKIDAWNWPESVATAPLVGDIRGLLAQVRTLFRENLSQTGPSGVKLNSPWQYLAILVEAEIEGGTGQQSTPLGEESEESEEEEFSEEQEPVRRKRKRPKKLAWLRRRFDGLLVRSSENAWNRAPEFVKRSGRWYRAARRKTASVVVWKYRLSSVAEKRKYDAR